MILFSENRQFPLFKCFYGPWTQYSNINNSKKYLYFYNHVARLQAQNPLLIFLKSFTYTVWARRNIWQHHFKPLIYKSGSSTNSNEVKASSNPEFH